jgi:hypothetical protein
MLHGAPLTCGFLLRSGSPYGTGLLSERGTPYMPGFPIGSSTLSSLVDLVVWYAWLIGSHF